ncbi:NAD(P)H-hydrate dehydratase [Psychrobacter sp. UBA5136]|uniref:NAD(P)H-hydrate dehydratase n=1 Tax=Psychrobacter sp. UBA5136 TaxID=1947356 RepID=UPI0025EC2DB1|nr:NAD(P)H-hydrate dehydratase [Psychrobacter sp. UBA5136]
MTIPTDLFTNTAMPVALYSSKQIYVMEQEWFAQGHDSFGLMKQAAWQMAHHIVALYEQKMRDTHASTHTKNQNRNKDKRRASIWVGKGNNGGDGWLIAYYLQQMGWQVQIITVGFDIQDFETAESTQPSNQKDSLSDAKKALQIALSANCPYQRFKDTSASDQEKAGKSLQADVYVDALFGIGLEREPVGIYKEAICALNDAAQHEGALVIAVDMPSGLVASTGQVFKKIAVQADATLCLTARKFGLHTNDGMDYSGQVIDIPLIPYQMDSKDFAPAATLMTTAHHLSPRRQNSYKGSYGHVLVIGGNRIDGSQGMGGAAILSASSTMATGAGKITVACHEAFHGALLTSLPDAMTINLHDTDGVKNLIKEASILAVGMGLGRDDNAKALFINYIQTAMEEKKSIVIDADGLYHLASLQTDEHKLIGQLKEYSTKHQVCLTPHSGEAARLLNKKVSEVEADRLAAIKQCAKMYGGNWVLKGAGSLVLEQKVKESQVYVCGVGNAGMASAGMGDVLSGVIAGLLAQEDLTEEARSLHQAVLLHGLAGDCLVKQTEKLSNSSNNAKPLLVGQRGLQAQDLPAAIRHVMQLMTD